MIKRYFLTGLALLLPVVVTFWILIFLVNLFTKPFENMVVGILSYYELVGKPFLFLSSYQLTQLLSKLLILFTLVALTIIVGIFARMVVAHYLIRFGDYLIARIPVINRIYGAAKEVVKTLFTENAQSFSQVVLVPFPSEGSHSLGMITSDFADEHTALKSSGMVSVFVPGTPNPTMGFLLLFHREQLIFLDLPVDEAIKSIISCGVTISELKEQVKQENYNEQPN